MGVACNRHVVVEVDAKAAHEGAMGNTRIAEKVTDMAENANTIMERVTASLEGTQKLLKQVERFKL